MSVGVGDGVIVNVGVWVLVGEGVKVGVLSEMEILGMLQATNDEVNSNTTRSSLFMDRTIHAREGGVKVG
jgi:hypothetical protein